MCKGIFFRRNKIKLKHIHHMSVVWSPGVGSWLGGGMAFSGKNIFFNFEEEFGVGVLKVLTMLHETKDHHKSYPPISLLKCTSSPFLRAASLRQIKLGQGHFFLVFLEK